MSAAAITAPPKAPAESAALLTTEGLQWMLLRSAARATSVGHNQMTSVTAAHGVACDVWLDAHDAAPEPVRQALSRSVTASAAGNAWAPAIVAVLTAADIDVTHYGFDTPLRAFVTATSTQAGAAVTRLFRALQCRGLFASAGRHVMAEAAYRSASASAHAFELLIADSNADAALPGPTRCSAGDAHNPPRHHSVRSADEWVTVHDVLFAAALSPAVWHLFSDARLPFGARAIDEEWAYALAGPCGCAGDPRLTINPLHIAIPRGNDEACEWLVLRLPSARLNEHYGDATPLLAALQSNEPAPRTVAALLSRVPDVDLTLQVKADDSGEYTAAEWIAHRPPEWLPPHLAAELKLKTQQFGAQYLPSAAVLCVEALQSLCGGVSGAVSGGVSGAVRLPRELVRLVLQYTALPQPNPWPNAHADATVTAAFDAADAASAATAGAGAVAMSGAADVGAGVPPAPSTLLGAVAHANR